MTIYMKKLNKMIFDRNMVFRRLGNPVTGSSACFLFGPRKTGKSTLVQNRFPDSVIFDLSNEDVLEKLLTRPDVLRGGKPVVGSETVIIDEVQRAPRILDEVQRALDNTSTRFVLCCSNPSKLKRKGEKLLGGRGLEHYLFPLTSSEIPDLDLDRMLNNGGIADHYLADDPDSLLKTYIEGFMEEEVEGESLTRDIPAFSRFLKTAALTHCGRPNYADAGRECGVSANTARNYYRILKETLFGFEIPAWKKKRKRRLIETSRFFIFDMGVANHLNPEVHGVLPGSDSYERAFEHFLINEIRACLSWKRRRLELSCWATSSGFEVDLILGEMDLVLDFKPAIQVRNADLKGLRALLEEYPVSRAMLVSRDFTDRRTQEGIELIHWKNFCSLLWGGGLF